MKGKTFKHIVFSGLENSGKLLGKPLKHFDEKAAIEEYGMKQAAEINFTSVRLPMYYQTLSLHKANANEFYLGLPVDTDKRVWLMDVEDIGGVVVSVFADPGHCKSKLIGVAGEYLKVSEYVAILNKHLSPAKVIHAGRQANRDHLKTLTFPGVDDVIDMFDFFNMEKMTRDLALTKKLNPKVTSFSDWVAKNKANLAK